jgi:small-conductance mechanosensitive channel
VFLLCPYLFDLAVHALDKVLYDFDALDDLLFKYTHPVLHRLLIVVVSLVTALPG